MNEEKKASWECVELKMEDGKERTVGVGNPYRSLAAKGRQQIC